jgi:hypothetical protein
MVPIRLEERGETTIENIPSATFLRTHFQLRKRCALWLYRGGFSRSGLPRFGLSVDSLRLPLPTLTNALFSL